MQTIQQPTSTSPWTVRQRIAMLLWGGCWTILCQWTPKPCNCWRLFILRLFGAKLHGKPFIHQRARIQIPWNITIHDQACVGDRANLYSLGLIEVMEKAVIAQEVYLCTGTHDFSDSTLPLQVAKITIGKNVFVGARALVLPGVEIGEASIIGAASVVTKNIPANVTAVGNPAKAI